MALDQAHAIVRVMLDEETEPSRRAKLIALQLALGWPHALAIEPGQLEELRTHERSIAAASTQRWLAATSAVAFVWCSGVSLLMFSAARFRGPEWLLFAAFVIGSLHGLVGLVAAWDKPSAPSLPLLAWSWPIGAIAAFICGAAMKPQLGLVALLCATPSLLVCLAASRVARHTAAR